MISISIIEDHEPFRSVLTNILNKNNNFKLTGIYSSGEEALVSLEDNRPNIVIVDIQLKNMSGIDVIKHIKGKIPDTQFLICTAHQDNDNVFKALRAGASGYIVKSSSVNEIQQAILELHAGGAPMSPYIARKVVTLIHKKDNPDHQPLSERELQVLSLLSKGLLYKEISDSLGIATNTVKNHCINIYVKLHVQNKVEAINKYRSL
jgi:NarL family two-component system response regulator LiaR